MEINENLGYRVVILVNDSFLRIYFFIDIYRIKFVYFDVKNFLDILFQMLYFYLFLNIFYKYFYQFRKGK